MPAGNRRRSGFILSEALICLLICLMMLPIAADCLSLFAHRTENQEQIQDEIALAQLRHILTVSYELECQGSQLVFQYHQQECLLRWTNSHLILTPGTQIFLSKMEEPYFYEENGCICISYQRKGKTYEKILVHR